MLEISGKALEEYFFHSTTKYTFVQHLKLIKNWSETNRNSMVT